MAAGHQRPQPRRTDPPLPALPLEPAPPRPARPLFVWKCCRCHAELMHVFLPPGAVLADVRCWACGEMQGREAAA